ncbi:hypothetical protein C7974DRAFT_377797 [Boeremia exigua]|uniref:uncharacterized protein n=1 Tax=Boeremia exigua TaxID=749465 RepID=UPI001E8CE1C0|nr:uncharacterized protein C7974DRAFT_377797 [Boeremia exigua]KAH6622199.1 hypothetical protein C7974DRAFT_377797 [Boeremia exigua]
MAEPGKLQGSAINVTHISPPPPALHVTLNASIISGEREPGCSDATTRTLPSPAHHAVSVQSTPIITPLLEQHETYTSVWNRRYIHKWRSPFLMVLFFVLGAAVSIAHCVFYPKLNGKIVGDSYQQEEKIRFGTACSFLAQICLGASVWTVYTQWLWRTVKRKEMTIEAWNAAFSADTSVLSLLNWEMLCKLRVGSVLAFFAWSLLLPPFFTPATLFIYESTAVMEIIAAMPYPNIALGTTAHRYSYSPPVRRGTRQYIDDQSRVFTGPRTQLSLVSTAASSFGEILPADLPYNNSAYSVQFFAPIIKCEEADQNMSIKIDSYLQEGMVTTWGSAKESDSAYFGFVPTWNSTKELYAVWHPRQQTPASPLNQLWLTFLRPRIDHSGARVKDRHYQVCQPHNASYNLEVSQYHGVQNVTGNYTTGETVPFPTDGLDITSNMTQHAYTAFMWVLCDQLVGKLAWYVESNASTSPTRGASQFGIIESPISRTSLLGSLDLDSFFEFDEEKGLYQDQNMSQVYNFSDQRLKDKALARNRTLDTLIEELSFNTTVSLMHNKLFTNLTNTTVRLTDDVNRYSYKARGLFIPYALANFFTLLCVLIGAWSYVYDDVLPDKKIQDIIYAARPELRHGSRRWSVVDVDGSRRSVTIQVIQNDSRVGTEVQAERVSWHKIQWGRAMSQQAKEASPS